MTNSGRRRSTVADRSLRGFVVAALCLAATGTGCARHAPTPVARGEYYAAGKPDYDEFFVKLYRHQLDTAQALKSAQAARDELARAVGAPPNAKPSDLAPGLEKRGSELEQAGVTLTVPPRPPSSSEPEIEVQGEPKGDQATLIETLRGATRKLRGVELLARDGGADLDALRVRSLELDRQVDRVFWTDGAGKRSEVKNNLSDARELLVLMNDSRRQLGQSSSELLAILQGTFKAKTAPASEAEAEAAPVEPSRSKKKGRASGKRASTGKRNIKARPANKPAASAARPPTEAATPAPKASPAPKAKPAPKAEFEP